MKSIVYLIFTLILLSSFINAQDRLFLMPDESKAALKEISKSIKSAKKNIKIAIYSFTRKDIAKDLKKAAKKGIKIEALFDKKSNKKDKKSIYKNLASYKNIDIYLLSGLKSKSGKHRGKLHQKLMLIDDKIAIFGSANWSYSAFSINYENLFVTTNRQIVKKFVEYFNNIKKKAKLYD